MPRYLLNKHVYLFIYLFAAVQSLILSDEKSEVPYLSDDKYKIWKDKILHFLCMDLDYALRKEEPPTPIELILLVRLLYMNLIA